MALQGRSIAVQELCYGLQDPWISLSHYYRDWERDLISRALHSMWKPRTTLLSSHGVAGSPRRRTRLQRSSSPRRKYSPAYSWGWTTKTPPPSSRMRSRSSRCCFRLSWMASTQ